MNECAGPRVAANPRLYDASGEAPALLSVRCSRCARLYFPPIRIGCAVCGAPDSELLTTPIAATGTVFAVARVHRPHTGRTAPFTVAEIVLDAGPLIRALVHPAASPVAIGSRVDGVWWSTGTDDTGSHIVEPVFAPAADEAVR